MELPILFPELTGRYMTNWAIECSGKSISLIYDINICINWETIFSFCFCFNFKIDWVNHINCLDSISLSFLIKKKKKSFSCVPSYRIFSIFINVIVSYRCIISLLERCCKFHLLYNILFQPIWLLQLNNGLW